MEYAPVARRNVARGYMTVRELLAAMYELSDNTAANLLLATLGGPSGYTQGLRKAGDADTILRHGEPMLNEPRRPGQVGDTTTPSAMAYDARNMVVGSYLQLQTRGTLQRWMIGAKTGLDLLRAGFPQTWTVGDKTGLGGAHNAFGDSDTRNDVAVAWAPTGAPLIVAAYLTGVTVRAHARDAALASIARIVTATLRP
jgi:beta-lactamase class A